MLVYLLWLAVYVWLPIAALWASNAKTVWRYKKTLGFCVLGAMLVSIPWDIWATQTNAWLFPSTSVIGIYFFGLPVEEYFFIACVTLLVATITLVVRDRFGKRLIKNSVMA